MQTSARLIKTIMLASTLACSQATSNDGNANYDVFSFEEPTPPELPHCTDSAYFLYSEAYYEWMDHNFNGYRGPYCIRTEDGFGGSWDYCNEHFGDTGPIPEYYSYCRNPAIWLDINNPTETMVRETPCLWWPIKYEKDTGQCLYDIVCVPEDRLTEVGWPAGVGFEYYETIAPEGSHCPQRADQIID